jgi:hypothetical protein
LSSQSSAKVQATVTGAVNTAATATIMLTGVENFFNDSLVPLVLTGTASGSENSYTLSLSGADSPFVIGRSAVDFTFFNDAQTTNGTRQVPLAFNSSVPIDPGQTLMIGGSPVTLQAQVQVVPEPSTLTLLSVATAAAAVLSRYRITRRRM